MKGVGLSTYYPIPSHREGGDIDIFTYSADHSRKSDAEANLLADLVNGRKRNRGRP
ncbi:nucleotidyltransferase family protein [Phocaeicola dorei]|nr:nucleotidyltransferase family protein [Phocaeicola dorei]